MLLHSVTGIFEDGDPCHIHLCVNSPSAHQLQNGGDREKEEERLGTAARGRGL